MYLFGNRTLELNKGIKTSEEGVRKLKALSLAQARKSPEHSDRGIKENNEHEPASNRKEGPFILPKEME